MNWLNKCSHPKNNLLLQDISGETFPLNLDMIIEIELTVTFVSWYMNQLWDGANRLQFQISGLKVEPWNFLLC